MTTSPTPEETADICAKLRGAPMLGTVLSYDEIQVLLDAANALEAQGRAISSLSAEKEELRAHLAAALEALEQLGAQLAAAREALEPFAACAEELDGSEDVPRAPDGEWAKFRLLTDDYRRARAAFLSGAPR